MLYFIGLGIEQSPTLKAVECLKQCAFVFYESYTSPIVEKDSIQNLRNLGSPESKFEIVKRSFVEDGRNILDLAGAHNVALVCSGDPLVATTHQELLTRALRSGVTTRVLHGSSILSAIGGELGLHSYNFGRTVTVTREPMQYTAYNTIFQNLLRGLHTTILLEWDEPSKFFLSPAEALETLLNAERDIKFGFMDESTLVLVGSRLGSQDSEVRAGTLKDIKNKQLGDQPHVMVIPGKMHFTEREAISSICGINMEGTRDNSERILRIADQMLSKYSKKTLRALERARKAAREKSDGRAKFDQVFENVECYTQDALRFLNEGKDELAVLSIGYAEGLLDSLRFTGELEFEW